VSGWKRVVLTDKDTRLVELIAENCQRNEKWLPRAGLQSLPNSHTNSPANSPPVVVARHGVWAHSASHDSLWAESEGQGYDGMPLIVGLIWLCLRSLLTLTNGLAQSSLQGYDGMPMIVGLIWLCLRSLLTLTNGLAQSSLQGYDGMPMIVGLFWLCLRSLLAMY
jgi:hypothetical protein